MSVRTVSFIPAVQCGSDARSCGSHVPLAVVDTLCVVSQPKRKERLCATCVGKTVRMEVSEIEFHTVFCEWGTSVVYRFSLPPTSSCAVVACGLRKWQCFRLLAPFEFRLVLVVTKAVRVNVRKRFGAACTDKAVRVAASYDEFQNVFCAWDTCVVYMFSVVVMLAMLVLSFCLRKRACCRRLALVECIAVRV